MPTVKRADELKAGDTITTGSSILRVASVRPDPHPSFVNVDFADGTSMTAPKSAVYTLEH